VQGPGAAANTMLPTHTDEQFLIIADAERPVSPPRVLKYDDTFAVFDHRGDIRADYVGEHGLYHDGTRYLSQYELAIFGARPLLLSSTISTDNARFDADLTNADVVRDGRIVIARGDIHLLRSRVLSAGYSLDRLRVVNYARTTVDVLLAIRVDADFADVFEVRGTRRRVRGDRLPPQSPSACDIRYRGLDGLVRGVRLSWSLKPQTCSPTLATFVLPLEPTGTAVLEVAATCDSGDARPRVTFTEALATTRARQARHAAHTCHVESSNTALNRWLGRSTADLQMMETDGPGGLYPYAGIPWFSTPFGRDGLITAFELLWVEPILARGVLTFLASTQATAHNDARDAQPGKILHEMRGGEMAALGEVPFKQYYGTTDATPLFVMLAAAYYRRTGDADTIERIWPNIAAALQWMITSGDVDGDGFIEYARRSDTGLIQQGWKDSYDSIFHEDGSLAEGPIALCEVQGYAYGAWKGAARLAAMRGDKALADDWHARAEALRAKFERVFWCEDLGTYALALDGRKRPCRVRTSNPGHCLFTGIVSPERARRVAETLMSERMFSGWGIRTVASGEARYNPMSYHNGSVWPHDNAIIAMGLARYGLTAPAVRILAAMFDLSDAMDLHRLPELICGFARHEQEHPTLYPVACSPQAWASGAVYMILGACLGLRIDAPQKRVSFSTSGLPETVDRIQLTNLVVGDARVDLQLDRHAHDVGLTVLKRDGQVDIVVIR